MNNNKLYINNDERGGKNEKVNIKKLIISSLTAVSALSLNQIGANAEWKQDSNGWWNTEGSSWW